MLLGTLWTRGPCNNLKNCELFSRVDFQNCLSIFLKQYQYNFSNVYLMQLSITDCELIFLSEP